MKSNVNLFWIIKGSSLLYILFGYSTATAQIIPDNTLPINSQVISKDNIDVIYGGTTKGDNLFHSFKEFTVLTGKQAYFNNSTNIQNIIVRTTGNSASTIDGLLQTNGTANLVFFNPNGIIFEKNARLDIGGSFLASTANSIKFADGSEFRANSNEINSLLTISVPIGLQIGDNSGAIQVQGTGQGLITQSTITYPYIRNNEVSGLRVQPGNTLALVGSNILVEAGTLTAEQGRIELGSVASGIVELNPVTQGWNLSYGSVSSFKDINLSQKALIDASGNSSGSIALQGKQISVNGGSVILNQNLGSQPSGDITVNASESLKLSGTSADGKFISNLQTESLGSGKAANIAVSTQQLIIDQGGRITSKTYGAGNGGNIDVNASKSTQLLGFSSFDPFITSGVVTTSATSSTGKAGNIVLSTDQLLAKDGGLITSLMLGNGSGGSVIINATNSVELVNSVELINSELGNYVYSYLSSETARTGNAGNLTIKTSRLVVGAKATVNTTTRGLGSAGIVAIYASDIEVSGSINSSAIKASTNGQKLFGAPPIPQGSPGELIINTDNLKVINNGMVSVTNQGTSTAGGTLQITANTINLTNNASINATTASGEGGDIFLASSLLQLRNSAITATAGGTGNGGNIRIAADILTAADNSAITANAYEGRGGNIRIDTRGFFVSPDTQITASSERGIDGTVQVNFQERNPSQSKAQPEAIAQQPQIVSVCQGRSGKTASTFVNVGTGGLAASSDGQTDSTTWQRNSSPVQAINNSEQSTTEQPTEIVEAQGWVVNANGDIVLVAKVNPAAPYALASSSTCHVQPATVQVSSGTKTGSK